MNIVTSCDVSTKIEMMLSNLSNGDSFSNQYADLEVQENFLKVKTLAMNC